MQSFVIYKTTPCFNEQVIETRGCFVLQGNPIHYSLLSLPFYLIGKIHRLGSCLD